jgi:HEPN domain-containing protein
LSPSPEQIEYAEMLQRLASGDLYACRKLADDAEIEDHIIGFHAQQAVEKALKVALVLADSELTRTHDLELLAEQVEGAGTTVPDELSRTDWLTPWAAELRYDEQIALDRAAALAVAESAIAWAASLLDGSAPDVPPTQNREENSGGSSSDASPETEKPRDSQGFSE